jgi:hypothetical protein
MPDHRTPDAMVVHLPCHTLGQHRKGHAEGTPILIDVSGPDIRRPRSIKVIWFGWIEALNANASWLSSTTTTSGEDTAPSATGRPPLGSPSWNNLVGNYS